LQTAAKPAVLICYLANMSKRFGGRATVILPCPHIN